MTAPATFDFTYPASPERHLRAAELLGANLSGITPATGRSVLPATILSIVNDTGGPRGVAEFGYGEADIPDLVEGTMKQQRLLVCCPRSTGPKDVKRIIFASMKY